MFISIILPVYNEKKYICDCIDSIANQSFKDWEAIFVDDHGTDNSIELARHYISQSYKDISHKFRFIETERNSGPGVARNTGIEAAKGDYIAFVDSDDSINPEMLTEMARVASHDGADMVCCNILLQEPDGKQRVANNPDISKGKRHYLRHFKTFCVSYIYKRAFVNTNNLRFPANRAAEDTNFLTKAIILAQSMGQVNKALYIYQLRQDSISKYRNRKRYKDRLSSISQLRKDMSALMIEERYKELNLKRYRPVLAYIYLKKGIAQAILDLIRN